MNAEKLGLDHYVVDSNEWMLRVWAHSWSQWLSQRRTSSKRLLRSGGAADGKLFKDTKNLADKCNGTER